MLESIAEIIKGNSWSRIISGKYFWGYDAVCSFCIMDTIPAYVLWVFIADLVAWMTTSHPNIIVVWRSSKSTTCHEWRWKSIFGGVGYQVIFDGVYIYINNSRILLFRSQFFTQKEKSFIENSCSIIIAWNTAIWIEVIWSFLNYWQFLRKTSQRPSIMNPKFPATLSIYLLQQPVEESDLWNEWTAWPVYLMKKVHF